MAGWVTINKKTCLSIDQEKQNSWTEVEMHLLDHSTSFQAFGHPKNLFHNHFQKTGIHVDLSVAPIFSVYTMELNFTATDEKDDFKVESSLLYFTKQFVTAQFISAGKLLVVICK